ncbi:hypothetical protein Dvina_31875 [Dactylosporangium vinaceum]|uniref:Uncharacterized protein n=1 Tax=Dactylosporangium vinaceum TaxID=53362 RepID=A0ABV5MAS0_9ACTN|nr:hypothetical protein [Dactylosporangium vinaceum]UAB92895.1 hypothetical protein Dvina_31875 [Dactylosporangium vinaceum]
MNGIDVLRESLDEHADLASGGAGLLDDVTTGAARLRRRRRITAAAAGVLVLAVVATLAAGQFARPTLTPAAPYSRGMLQLGASVAAGSGFELQGYVTSADVQRLVLGQQVQAEVHDPGTYDPSTLAGAERIGLGNGATGFALPVFTAKDAPGTAVAAVARRDATGAWIIAYGKVPQDLLVKAAVAVQIGPPRDVRAPLRLGFVPDGLRAVSVDSRPADVLTILSFQDADHRLVLWAMSQLGQNVQFAALFGPPVPIAGHDTWYITKENSDWFGDNDTSAAALVVQYEPGCSLTLRTPDARTVTRAMLEQMARETRFGSCTDRSTWTTLLG